MDNTAPSPAAAAPAEAVVDADLDPEARDGVAAALAALTAEAAPCRPLPAGGTLFVGPRATSRSTRGDGWVVVAGRLADWWLSSLAQRFERQSGSGDAEARTAL